MSLPSTAFVTAETMFVTTVPSIALKTKCMPIDGLACHAPMACRGLTNVMGSMLPFPSTCHTLAQERSMPCAQQLVLGSKTPRAAFDR